MHDREEEATRGVDELAGWVELVGRVVRDLDDDLRRRPPPPKPSAGADATVDWLVRHRPRAARWLRGARRRRAER